MERGWAVFILLVFALPAQAAIQIYYIHNDHLGTPRVITNQSQQVVWKGHPKPFGETQVEIETITNHRRFPGQRFDIESRLHYNYFRDYDPTAGRYIQSDPVGLNGGLNTFLYGRANPLSFFDPFGLEEYPDDFVGPLPENGYHTSEMTHTKCGNVPPGPPAANIGSNMFLSDIYSGEPLIPRLDWIYNMVRNGGSWDYKQKGRKYEDFGNFNFGASGSAADIPSEILNRGAGYANQRADPTRTQFGNWYGKYPYGDDPVDQEEIGKGIEFCQCMGY